MAFQPGQSGNPSGRPKVNAEIVALAREKTPAAFARVVELSASEDERVSLAACQEIINRAYGKPAQAVTGEGGEGPVEFADLTLRDRARALAMVLSALNGNDALAT